MEEFVFYEFILIIGCLLYICKFVTDKEDYKQRRINCTFPVRVIVEESNARRSLLYGKKATDYYNLGFANADNTYIKYYNKKMLCNNNIFPGQMTFIMVNPLNQSEFYHNDELEPENKNLYLTIIVAAVMLFLILIELPMV